MKVMNINVNNVHIYKKKSYFLMIGDVYEKYNTF